jgi:4-hydroxy-tetrahydrodipicolinate synthase
VSHSDFVESLSGIMVTTVTPFNSDLSLNEKSIRANVRFLIENNVDIITPAGSIGEWGSLTTDELGRLISISVDEAKGGVPVLAGASSTSTIEATKRAKVAEEAGADALLVLPPSPKYSIEGLVKHYKMVAESTSLPIVLYNAPDFLGFELSTSELSKIIDQVESVVAIKDATTDMLEFSNRLRVLKKIKVILGNEPYCYHGLVAGSQGTFNSVSNFAPHPIREMYNAIREKRIDEARSIYLKLTEYFSFRRQTRNPIAVVKQSMVERGVVAEPYVRPPLTELSLKEKQDLKVVLEHLTPELAPTARIS